MSRRYSGNRSSLTAFCSPLIATNSITSDSIRYTTDETTNDSLFWVDPDSVLLLPTTIWMVSAACTRIYLHKRAHIHKNIIGDKIDFSTTLQTNLKETATLHHTAMQVFSLFLYCVLCMRVANTKLFRGAPCLLFPIRQ